MEPVGAGEELVGEGVVAEEVDQAIELSRVFGSDVGGTALKMLGVADTTHAAVHVGIAETGIDDDGTADGLSGRLQQVTAAVGHIGNLLNGRNVLRVLLQVAELAQLKVRRELDVIEILFHGIVF